MHSINHPKLFVLADLARVLLEREGIESLPDVEQYVDDQLAEGPVWPVYPEVGQRLGVAGHYLFKRARALCSDAQPVLMLGLKDFVQESFQAFAKYRREDLICERLASSRYQELTRFLGGRPVRSVPSPAPVVEAMVGSKTSTGANPYHGLPDYQFWRRAVERPARSEVDPVVRPRFGLQRDERIATAGSCFAQHISRTLHRHGFNYYIAESGDALPRDEAQRRSFGVFSARFGNVYTSRQLVQLFDRAYGHYVPSEVGWRSGDGRWVDPFRPQVEPNGFASVGELVESRSLHFSAVREMFEKLQVLVFTLGLTEAWRHRIDGAVYPLAPGVIAGKIDPGIHEFVNFSVADVVADMQAFIARLLAVNPRARMILTVSPVPLIATYEDRHVLLSTTHSKAVLRVAAEEICKRNQMTDYFPSYEIITGNHARGEYFASDLRSVQAVGVDHVMKLFMRHYAGDAHLASDDSDLMRENQRFSEVICDEEALDVDLPPNVTAVPSRVAPRLLGSLTRWAAGKKG